MLKLLSGITVVAFTTLCGYLLAQKYRKRDAFFSQLKEFNERFLNEITYARRPMRQFIVEYEYRGEFRDFLQSFCADLEKEGGQEHYVAKETEYSFLKEEERRLIRDYFQMLGRGDSASQKNYFSSQKEVLLKMQTEAKSAVKQRGDLYVKLGFLAGLLILILII